jgi:hypothetical protein
MDPSEVLPALTGFVIVKSRRLGAIALQELQTQNRAGIK